MNIEGVRSAADLFGNKRLVFSKKHATERGDLLKYFAEKTGKPVGYIALRLTGIPTADLYFIQKQCDQYKGPWSKAFFGMLKPNNENRASANPN